MAMARHQFQALIDAGELTISPFDSACMGDNFYIVHNDGTIRVRKKIYTDISGTVMDSRKPFEEETIIIPKNGYVLEPNVTYYMTTLESIQCNKFTVSLSPERNLAGMGLTVIMDRNVTHIGSGKPVTVSVTAVDPIIIYSKQEIAELYPEENESGFGYVPIGGIIAYCGSAAALPTGFCLCDGSHGSPNLIDRFIRGTGWGGIGVTGGKDFWRMTVPQLARHRHGVVAQNVVSPGSGGDSGTVVGSISQVMMHTEYEGQSEEIDNRPYYYQLAYVMRYM